MAQAPYTKPVQSRPRAVRLALRDGDTVDGGIYLTDGQALAPYLGSRKDGWVNIVNAAWGREGEIHKHAVLQTGHILLASASRADYPVVAAAANGVPRPVELLLENGTRLQGNLLLGLKQRLSDYLAGTGGFIGLLGASRVEDGTAVGDVAVNSICVKAVRDTAVLAPTPARSDAVAPRRTVAVDAARSARTPTGTFDAIPDAANLTPEQLKRATVVSRHWLTQLVQEAQLLPPDARDLSDACTLNELWSSVAMRNDLADAEIAGMIATAYKLDLAEFEEVTAAAIKCVPAKIARRLGVLPVRIDGRALVVAVSDPESLDIEQQLGFVTKHQLRRVIASPADLAGAIDWYYAEGAAPAP